MPATRGWKYVNFLGRLLRFPVGCHLKTIVLYFTERNCFLENVALKNLPLRLHWSTWINSYSMYKQLHRDSIPRYCAVCKNKILTECKSGGSSKSSHQTLACGNREAPYQQIVNVRRKYNILVVTLWVKKNFLNYIKVEDNLSK